MEQEMITVFLKGGKEKQVPIEDIEIWLTERIDETELRYIPPKFPRPEGLDDSDVFPDPDPE